jgi:NitT/TauT family transport system ATP-binding protein
MTGDDGDTFQGRQGLADLTAPGVRPSAAPITAGFVALVDCAPLIVAGEKGFAAREGLDLTLAREPSWANIRDRIGLGHFDVAHMLAPMAIATTLRLGPLDAPVLAPFVLDLCGNAIAVSKAVHRAMALGDDPGSIHAPAETSRALARVVEARRAAGAPPLTFAMTYPFSSHNYELRYWLASAGIDPDRDVRLIVVPPPMMVEAMAEGHVDGFCVGAPWPAMTVVAGLGHIVATTAAMKPASPEKVLGLRRSFADRNPERLDRLLRAMQAACDWCDDPSNVDELATLLARPDRVGVPADVIRWSLTRQLITDPGGQPIAIPDYIRFSGQAANRPREVDALWYATQMVRWGQVGSLEAALEAARATFRADLYDRALGRPETADIDRARITLYDGLAFDPVAPDDYLHRLPHFA